MIPCHFHGADLLDRNLRRIDLSFADLSGTNLNGTDLCDTNIRETRFLETALGEPICGMLFHSPAIFGELQWPMLTPPGVAWLVPVRDSTRLDPRGRTVHFRRHAEDWLNRAGWADSKDGFRVG